MSRRNDSLDRLVWTCTPCGKATYSSRKHARTMMRRLFPADRMRAYPCPAGDGYHFGHVPDPQRRRGVLIIPDRGPR